MSTIKIAFLLTGLVSSVVSGSGINAQGQDSGNNRSAISSETADRATAALQDAVNLALAGDESAGKRLLDAMQLWSQASEPGKAARSALQLGDAYKKAKQYRESLDCYDRALDVYPLDRRTQVAIFNSIANVYSELYQRDLAFTYCERAIKLAKAISDNAGRSVGLAGLADLYYRDGNRKQSLACIAQARQFDANRNHLDEARLDCLAGEIYTERGLLDQAEKAFDDALAAYEKAGDEEGQINVICSTSNLHLVSGRGQLALQLADRAVEWAEKRGAKAENNTDALKAREVRWRAWLCHARAHRAIGDRQTAIRSYRLAIHHLEGLYLLVYVYTESSAVAFREKLQVPYRELMDVLIDDGRIQEAFQSVEHAKARVILGMAEARRTTESRAIVDEKGSLRPLSESIARLRIQLSSSKITLRERARLGEKMKSARDQLQEARARLEMPRSRKRIGWFQPATVEELQKRMAEDGETILEFALGENRSFAWLLSAQDFSVEILPGKKEIERQVGNFIELIRTAPSNMLLERDLAVIEEQGKALFSTLFGQLYDKVSPGKKLIIVPDGVLYYLPFESLLRGKRYVIEDHQISYVSSASMLALWQDSKARAENEDKMELLAFGDPIFKPELEKSSGSHAARQSNVLKRPRVSRAFQLPPLPRTRDEVEYIASLFPSNRQRLYLGRDSTEDAVKREHLRRYRRLHFATHGLIDETSPSRSAIVLTLGSNSEEDGLLEVDEIAELDLDCDLVVLSACQTARGQLLTGEGIIGLTRAFFYAGARSVVVSQWSVSDISTGQLMKTFYQNIVANIGYAAALRSAKLQMLRSETETRHPYYWASFILIGKP